MFLPIKKKNDSNWNISVEKVRHLKYSLFFFIINWFIRIILWFRRFDSERKMLSFNVVFEFFEDLLTKIGEKISLSDRWAVWEYLRVNISARVRTRKLKIGRKTKLESYFEDLDMRRRYAREISYHDSYSPKICRFDFVQRNEFHGRSWTLNIATHGLLSVKITHAN